MEYKTKYVVVRNYLNDLRDVVGIYDSQLTAFGRVYTLILSETKDCGENIEMTTEAYYDRSFGNFFYWEMRNKRDGDLVMELWLYIYKEYNEPLERNECENWMEYFLEMR